MVYLAPRTFVENDPAIHTSGMKSQHKLRLPGASHPRRKQAANAHSTAPSPGGWGGAQIAQALALALFFSLLLHTASSPSLRGAAEEGVAPPPPKLFLASPHCAATDLAAAPAAAPPQWVQSGVYNGEALLDFSLGVPAAGSLTAEWMASAGGVWAPIETMIFLHVLGAPKVRHFARLVVDVGANMGYFSQVALKMGYEVLAFEPQRRAQPYLAATAARNGGAHRLHLHACAVGAVQGAVTMSESPQWEVSVNEGLVGGQAGAPAGAAPPAAVPMVALRDLLIPGVPIALLKIDVEGFERGVFAGLTPEVLAGVRNIVVEVKTGESREHIMRLLGGAGFHCRQYQELYREKFSLRMPPAELASLMAQHLVPCTSADPEDFWFTREDFPWQCRAVGC